MSAVSIHSLSDPAQAERAIAKRELPFLQVFHGLGMGGAETWLISLLKYFQKQNENASQKVKFDILLTGGEKAVFDDEATALGARLFYVTFTRKRIGKFVRQFRRILRDGNYDAIHDHQDYIAGLHFAMGAGVLPPVAFGKLKRRCRVGAAFLERLGTIATRRAWNVRRELRKNNSNKPPQPLTEVQPERAATNH